MWIRFLIFDHEEAIENLATKPQYCEWDAFFQKVLKDELLPDVQLSFV